MERTPPSDSSIKEYGAGEHPVTTLASKAPSEEVDALVRLFEQIASEEGWKPGSGIRDYQNRSVYFALNDSLDGGVIGGLQLICADGEGKLPCHRIWPEFAVNDLGRTAHVIMLAVGKEWRRKNGGRRGGASFGASGFWVLTGALWRYCMENGITDLWLEATPTMLRCYRLLGWPLQVRGPLRRHWGEDCYLCSLSLRETAGALVEKALRSRTYRRIIETALDAEHDKTEKGIPSLRADPSGGTVT